MTEALRLLDNACNIDSSHVIRVFPVIRRVCSKASNVEIGLPSLQFLLRHGVIYQTFLLSLALNFEVNNILI